MSGITGVELHVADIEASIRFYEALGFRVVRRWEDWVRLDRDGAELVLQGDAYVRGHEHYFTPEIDRSPRGTGVEITVEVEDVEAVHAAAVAAGLRIVKPIQDRAWKPATSASPTPTASSSGSPRRSATRSRGPTSCDPQRGC